MQKLKFFINLTFSREGMNFNLKIKAEKMN